jgi:hypothetical protein
MWYAADVASGVVAVDVQFDVGSAFETVIWEVSGIAPADAGDHGSQLVAGSVSTTAESPQIATSQAGELVIAAVVSDPGISNLLSTDFVEDQSTGEQGWAHLVHPSTAGSAYQAMWMQNAAAPYCSVAAAFFPARQ